MFNANAPVVVVELGNQPISTTSNLEVAVSTLVISSPDSATGTVKSINGTLPDTEGAVTLLFKTLNGESITSAGNIEIIGSITKVDSPPLNPEEGRLYAFPISGQLNPILTTASAQTFLASVGLTDIPVSIFDLDGRHSEAVLSIAANPSGFTITPGGSGQNRTYSVAAGEAKTGAIILRLQTIGGGITQKQVDLVAGAQLFTVTTSANAGGSITPTFNAVEGGDYTVTATADSGYAVSSLTVDGVPMSNISQWTFNDIAANHTVYVAFIANLAPTISAIADQSTAYETSTGAIAFTIGDAETPAADLVVTATSSNQTLVPNASIVLGGSDANRTATITPANGQAGQATISIAVSDGTTTTTETFVLTVVAPLLLDSGAGAVNTLISARSPEFGGPWVNGSGELRVSAANRIVPTSASNRVNECHAAVGASNYTFSVDMVYDSNGERNAMVCPRFVDVNNTLAVFLVNVAGTTPTLYFGKYVSGAFTSLGTYVGEWTSGQLVPVTIICNGNNISVKTSGVERIAVTEAAHNNATSVAIKLTTASDFSAGNTAVDNIKVLS